MKNAILVCALMAAAGLVRAQDPAAASPYQGTSTPPPDDTIVTTSAPKPPAGRPAVQTPAPAPAPAQAAEPAAQPTSVDPSVNFPDPDGTIVHPQPAAPQAGGALASRPPEYDPDGDIVHPHPLGPNELAEGTSIRVKLMHRLSSAASERGQTFRSRVANDVLRDGQVMIPAGAEIEGQVAMASRGHVGGTGELRLRPETLILADGTRYRFSAQVTGTPASRNRVQGEGVIRPKSRAKRDALELGGGTAVGATAGALIGGPGGAIAGSFIGFGVVTTHLLVSHPQTTLESGDVLVLTLNERLNLVPSQQSPGN